MKPTTKKWLWERVAQLGNDGFYLCMGISIGTPNGGRGWMFAALGCWALEILARRRA